MRSPILLLLLLAAAAWLIWRFRRELGADFTTIGADGRQFRRIRERTLDLATGAGAPSVWRAVPDDGRDYFPDLGYDAGTSTQPPIMRSFGA